MLRSGFLTALALSALLTGCASPPPDADVTAVKTTEAQWLKDAATKNVDKWMEYYTDDASVLLADMPILTGKAAIRGVIKPMMDDPNFAVTFSATKVDVAKSGDLGYTQGAYMLTLSDPKTKAPYTDKGKYLTVYRKQTDGTWKAEEDTFMSDAPPPAPEPAK